MIDFIRVFFPPRLSVFFLHPLIRVTTLSIKWAETVTTICSDQSWEPQIFNDSVIIFSTWQTSIFFLKNKYWTLLHFSFALNLYNMYSKYPLNIQALFGCSRIRINPHVLGWIGVKLELNSTPIYFNTCELR